MEKLSSMSRELRDDDAQSVSSSAESFESSSNTGSSGTNHGVSVSSKEEGGLSSEQEIIQLAARETKTIRFWRILVLVVILAVGAAVAAGAWRFLVAQEDSLYQEGYTAFSTAVRDSSEFYVKNLLQATRGFAESISEYARASNETFPFVTIGIFETIARNVREQSGIESLVYSPLVRERDREAWEAYSVSKQGWIQQSIDQYQPSPELVSSEEVEYGSMDSIFPSIYSLVGTDTRIPSEEASSYAPYWHVSPFPSTTFFVNSDQLETMYFDKSVFNAASIAREGVFSQEVDVTKLEKDTMFGTDSHVKYHEQFLINDLNVTSALSTPHSYIVEPVFEQVGNPTSLVVGYVQGLVPWDRLLENVLPESVNGVYVLLQNNCGESYTYVLRGRKATFLGPGDLHDTAFDDTAVVIPLYDYENPDLTPNVYGHCAYTFTCYSSEEYSNSVKTGLPAIVVTAVCVIFVCVAVTFILYDRFVQKRNNIVLDAATKSHSILSSLFPSNIRDRLYAEKAEQDREAAMKGSSTLKSLLSDNELAGAAGEEDADLGYKGKPIADLFTEATVLFADISGFTAWSSVREPAQVFTLLETLYRAFDEIAKKRRVFKVETIGDCYVAVTGVPEPQKDHAVIMCRFARDMMNACRTLTKRLETRLGPDTGDLDMRVGIHSGPVTAGVLRGERSRFQLFGDTMNTASRTESTGMKSKIQLSQDTADILIAAGKASWISQREDKVIAKGKGEMTTYWLSIKADTYASSTAGSSDSGGAGNNASEAIGDTETAVKVSDEQTSLMTGMLVAEKTKRLIDWNCDVMMRLIKQIASRRVSSKQADPNVAKNELAYLQSGNLVIDEVQEIVHLPNFKRGNMKADADIDSIKVSSAVHEQLQSFVSNIAAMYRDNHFHNFEHASHVTMSVTKLLSRIVAPSQIDLAEESEKALHDHTYGITSDPLTQFACVFSALIHDVDHTGVPNAQLVKEKTPVADYYKNQSVAEQNSVDIAWHLLMDDSYGDLRRAIYRNSDELRRFRQLVVNAVMATDIVDKELKTLRNKRWDKAFSEQVVNEDSKDAIDRKATIVIEHLIQASDVSHTMQHWHIYRKWNERFFYECYQAFKDGRAENDPSESWYKGEIGFFDFYIIPLAKKLKDCGVFGVSSDEYLNYATRNRNEWEQRGMEVVQEMVEKAQRTIQERLESSQHGLIFL